MTLVTVATCALNQWAMDFEGNRERILESIVEAKRLGASFRTGPELEISGYGCNDHFLEPDTERHSWEVLASLLEDPSTKNILIDVGLPMSHKSVLYNCRLLFFNSEILLIRPKMALANDGNYREMRYFRAWTLPRTVEDFTLPQIIQKITGQSSVPIGDALLETLDRVVIGIETCEELFTPKSPHIGMALQGAQIVTNSSASHHQRQKLHRRVELIKNATRKTGGVYMYANQIGCDGERVYYDGCPLICLNGQILNQGAQFTLSEVQVVSSTIDLDEIRAWQMASASRGGQAAEAERYPTIQIPIILATDSWELRRRKSLPVHVTYYTAEEEIRYGPACWLWDYLRRSGMNGFFLPLSGGIDSCSTALIVYSMCQLICQSVQENNTLVLKHVQKMCGDASYIPTDSNELCSRIFHTSFMGSEHSSAETRSRASRLSEAISSYHVDCNIDGIIASFLDVFVTLFGEKPHFKTTGGCQTENLALQNLQARSRMVLSYLFAQLLLWHRGKPGSLLVLGSANVDETLRGYYTKYDCSSADLNPIGGISKTDLRNFISYMGEFLEIPLLKEFLDAPPTAELEPVTSTYVQSDEVDMGMTYTELSLFGSLRKIYRCGVVSMYLFLIRDWGATLSPRAIADKVKRFFYYYALNRHKTTTLTPSFHNSPYSPDDNRFDLRPFLYNVNWIWQFKSLNQLVSEHEHESESDPLS